MNAERWRRIEELLHAARLRPASARAAFLTHACGDDITLRSVIERLLAKADAASASPTGAPAWNAALEPVEAGERPAAQSVPDGSAVGRHIGPYHLRALIGAGGMGEVYRARDTRLRRDVAVKLLPAAFIADPDRLRRFEREARVLASLNHPHIAAIHGLEDADGVRAIVMELAEGETLATRIARGPLTVNDALKLARQIADALAAAHSKGVVHRDLKPANVALVGDAVKVLDFGLAKFDAGSRGTPTPSSAPFRAGITGEGVIVGTAAYMSPEQASGRPVDKRTDMWAFGCVLFEMLTGRAAFGCSSVSDTITHVLEHEPEWRRLPRDVPSRVRDLLRACLQKDRADRLAEIARARTVIDASLDRRSRGRLRALAVVSGVAAMAVAVIVAVLVSRRGPESSIPRLLNPVQVTSAVGVEDHPTLSPDGRSVAYESSESGNWDIWVAPIGGGRAMNRTADHAGADRYASWSPDGRRIAFWSDRDGTGYFVMPADGGPPVKMIPTAGIGESHHGAPSWSSDGTELAATVYDIVGAGFNQFVEIASLAAGERRRIRLPGTHLGRLDLSWSPDGRFLAYVDLGQQQSEIAHLQVLRLADGSASMIVKEPANVRRPRWSADQRYLLYVCNCVGPMDLWRQRIDDGAPVGPRERITSGLEVRDFDLSRDGRRLVYSKGRWVSNFWRVPIVTDRPATWADAEQVTFDQAYVEFLDVAADGKRVAYSSDRSGNQDIWVMPLGGEPVRLTDDPAPDWGPNWSPDGTRLTFYSYRTGDREIFVMSAAGGPAVQLTRSPGLDAVPHWSPDGSEIAFRSERTGNSEIWVIAADGSASRQITDHPANDGLATWSPDGRWLAFTSNRSGENRVWRVPRDGGGPEMLSRQSSRGLRWSREQDVIYFTALEESPGTLWRLSLRDGSERPMTNLIGRRGTLGIMQPALDGKFIYFPWRDDLGDIWVMDVSQ